jgi:putative peptidoglycan lipid II flippase
VAVAGGIGAGAEPARSRAGPNLKSRRTLISMAWIGLARGCGIGLSLVASVLIANRFGASASSDAFFFARNLVVGFAEAMRQVFLSQLVPYFAGPRTGRGFGAVAVTALTVAATLAVAGAWFAADIVRWLAPGFDDDRHRLATSLFESMFLLLPPMLAGAVAASALNAARLYGVSEIAAALPRLSLVLVLAFAIPPLGIGILAWALIAGATAGAVLLLAIFLRIGGSQQEEAAGPAASAYDPDRLAAILGVQAFTQAALWLDMWFVSAFPIGSVSIVEYSQRLMQLVPGVIASSVITVIYTEMARSPGSVALPALVARTIRAGLFAVLPIAAIFAGQAEGLVRMLFGHGQFDEAAVQTTATLLWLFAPTVPIGLVSNVLFLALMVDPSLQRARIVLPVLAVGLAVRAGALALLTRMLGLHGVPVAIAVSSAVVVIFLLALLRQYRAVVVRPDFLWALARICCAAGLAAAALALFGAVAPIRADQSTFSLLVRLSATGLLAVCGYAVASLLLRIEELRDLRAVFRK